MNNAHLLLKKITADPKLKAKCWKLAKNGKHQELEKLAKSLGTPCTYADILKEIKSRPKELSDEELLKIAGGKIGGGRSHPEL